MSENNVIGVNNTLPWRQRNDLLNFKKLTTGNSIIMGRKTFDSLGKPLPNRRNIVVTRNIEFTFEGVEVAFSLDEAFGLVENEKNAFVIGGANIYKQSLEKVDVLYITYIHTDLEGDAFFPEIDMNIWKEVFSEKHLKDEKNQFDYSFVKYERV